MAVLMCSQSRPWSEAMLPSLATISRAFLPQEWGESSLVLHLKIVSAEQFLERLGKPWSFAFLC
jgi:hypothetical protein